MIDLRKELWIAKVLAKKFSRGMNSGRYDDLLSIGYLALVECAARFDSSRGVKFSTYAYRRVKGAMIDDMRREPFRPELLDDPNDIVTLAGCTDDNTEARLSVHEALLTLSEVDRRYLVGEMFGATAKGTGEETGHSRSWASRIRLRALSRAAAVLT